MRRSSLILVALGLTCCLQSSSQAQVYLSGPLSGVLVDTTYVIDDSIRVQSGESLIIEPGATFYFNGNYRFSIYGYLYAAGTPADSIYFFPYPGLDSVGTIVFAPSSSDSSVISYCRITGCGQGAINLYSTNLTISHSTITDNQANWGGGIYCSSSNANISACVITDNVCRNNGGGIYCTNSSPRITDCIVSGNLCNTQPTTSSGRGGGGICANHSSSPVITGCTISDNYSLANGGGISINDNSNPSIAYCLIADNTCDSSGGGLAIFDSSTPALTHCTLSGDSTAVYGGGIYVYQSDPIIKNTIIAGSLGNGGVYFVSSPNAALTYGDFYNLRDFMGAVPANLGQIVTVNANGDSCDTFFNIFSDPLFVNAPSGDFHLQAESPCIDAGDPTSPLDPDSTIADIGAFYFDQTAPPEPEIALSTDSLDFDTVLVGEQGELPLTIYNVGGATLVLYSIIPSQPAFATDFNLADSLILPGDSLLVMVIFTPPDSIPYDGILSIENNDTLAQVQLHGIGQSPVGLAQTGLNLPLAFAVSEPYPNPFNPTTVLRFALPVASMVKIEVYDIAGRSVWAHSPPRRTPLQMEAGEHQINFDGTGLPSGIYIYHLEAQPSLSEQANDFTASGKMVLMK